MDTIEDVSNVSIESGKTTKTAIDNLVPFREHIFIMPEDNSSEMEQLKTSIDEFGVINRIIVRPYQSKSGEQKECYEILSGHRRVRACQLLNITEVPIEIRELKDDEANTLVIESNIHRSTLTKQEKIRVTAKLYGTKKHQGRKLSNDEQDAEQSTRNIVAKIMKISESTVQNYIALNRLNDKLLNKIGSKNLPISAARELSSIILDEESQLCISKLIEDGNTISNNIANKIKKQVSGISEYSIW